jgi:hypothetical protein
MVRCPEFGGASQDRHRLRPAHLRGRSVIRMPGVVPWDSVWHGRQHVHSVPEVDMTLGGTFIPRGLRSLAPKGMAGSSS